MPDTLSNHPGHTTATITRDGKQWVATIPGKPPESAASLADVLVKVYTAATGGAVQVVMPYRDDVQNIVGAQKSIQQAREVASSRREELIARMKRDGVTAADQRRIMSPIPQPRGGL